MNNIKRASKKLASLLLCAAIILAAVPYAAAADDKSALPFDVGSNIVLLIEPESGAVIFAQNENRQVPIASVTKIMTLLLIFEAAGSGGISMDDAVTVSKTAAATEGSSAFIDAGAQYMVSELVKTIVIASANDSAVAMAEHIAGSEAAFVGMMNKKAAELNMGDTVFKTCTGLPASGQYSTASDVAIMARALTECQEYSENKAFTTWMDTLVHPSGRVTDLTNTNRLVRFFSGTDGLKTGYSSEAKHCIVASAARDGTRFLTVLLGFDTSKARFDIAQKLLGYGFNSYEKITVVKAGDIVKESVPVRGASVKTTNLIAQADISILVKKSDSNAYSVQENIPELITAPVNSEQPVGGITVTLADGTTLYSPVVIDADEIGSGFFPLITRILSLW